MGLATELMNNFCDIRAIHLNGVGTNRIRRMRSDWADTKLRNWRIGKPGTNVANLYLSHLLFISCPADFDKQLTRSRHQSNQLRCQTIRIAHPPSSLYQGRSRVDIVKIKERKKGHKSNRMFHSFVFRTKMRRKDLKNAAVWNYSLMSVCYVMILIVCVRLIFSPCIYFSLKS